MLRGQLSTSTGLTQTEDAEPIGIGRLSQVLKQIFAVVDSWTDAGTLVLHFGARPARPNRAASFAPRVAAAAPALGLGHSTGHRRKTLILDARTAASSLS